MNALRRAIGRKEVLIGQLLSLPAGGWFGWRFLVHPASAQVAPVTFVQQVTDLLDAGQFSQSIAQADTLPAAQPNPPSIFRYKAIAQLLSGNPAGALQTADAALAAGATGADQAAVLAVKALVLTGQEYQQIAAAKAASLEASGLAGEQKLAASPLRTVHQQRSRWRSSAGWEQGDPEQG
jgi:hypothetical protein